MHNGNCGKELSKEARFDSPGHLIRIKIQEAANGTPLSFSEIKRKAEIGSSQLAFHLDKLKGSLK
jgi:hypothetical protein